MPGAKNPGRAEIGNWLIAIPRDAKNKDAAVDFLLWATSAGTNEAVGVAWQSADTQIALQRSRAGGKVSGVSRPSCARWRARKPRPRTPFWNEIENVFGIYLSKANSGELSAEDAMNQANAEIAKILERAK